MRRAHGFTLVELLVALFAMALLAALSWRGIDGMVRSRETTTQRSDEVLALQVGLAQWNADLDAVVEYPPLAGLDWNGRVLRLTRRGSQSPYEGTRVIAWAQREGYLLRWQSPPVLTRGELEVAWEEAEQWARNPSDAARRAEVAIAPMAQWQIFFYRENAWTNPQSSAATAEASAGPGAARRFGGGPAARPTTLLPDGVRVVMDLPPGRALAGRLVRDWIRPTAGRS